jgi:hypothetical protein
MQRSGSGVLGESLLWLAAGFPYPFIKHELMTISSSARHNIEEPAINTVNMTSTNMQWR